MVLHHCKNHLPCPSKWQLHLSEFNPRDRGMRIHLLLTIQAPLPPIPQEPPIAQMVLVHQVHLDPDLKWKGEAVAVTLIQIVGLNSQIDTNITNTFGFDGTMVYGFGLYQQLILLLNRILWYKRNR